MQGCIGCIGFSPSKYFVALHFAVKSMIHSELIFMMSIKSMSRFIVF